MESLTMEEMQARLASLEADKKELQDALEKSSTENKKLSTANKQLAKAAKAEAEKKAPPSIEVEGSGDIESGTYVFTAPSFTWDDGKVINTRQLVADAQSENEKVSQRANSIIADLLARQSGILRRKEKK